MNYEKLQKSLSHSPLNITGEQHRAIVSLLDHYLPGAAAWAFGSRIKYSSRQNSDLDLVVFAETNDQLNVDALKDAFDESNLPFRIDLHVWNELPENFQKNIKEKYIIINN